MKTLRVDEKTIRRKMIDRDIKTINNLAARSGVSKPTIYEYLNGKSPLSDAFIRLCSFLEVNPMDVLTEAEIEDQNNV